MSFPGLSGGKRQLLVVSGVSLVLQSDSFPSMTYSGREPTGRPSRLPSPLCSRDPLVSAHAPPPFPPTPPRPAIRRGTHVATIPDFYVGVGDLNSGLHACVLQALYQLSHLPRPFHCISVCCIIRLSEATSSTFLLLRTL